MKKLLSIVLVLAMVLSLTLTSFSTSAATVDVNEISENALSSMKDVLSDIEIAPVIKPEIATTSVRTYSVSEEAGVSYDSIDGYIYGYIGDADGDDTVSVMDATAIQLHCAETQIMIATLCKMADADMDNATTVMDATSIQLHLASIKESDYINHVLYTPYDNFDPLLDTFDDIANYIVANGEFDKSESSYYLESTQETDGVEIYTRISHALVEEGLYDPDILIYTITYFPEYDSYCKVVTTFTRGLKTFNIYAKEYIDDITLYQIWSRATITNISDSLELEYDTKTGMFTSDYDITYSEVKELIPNMCFINLYYGEELIMYDVAGSILDLVYDVQSLM